MKLKQLSSLPVQSCHCAVCGSSEFKQTAFSRDYIYCGSVGYYSFVSCNVCGAIYMNPQPTMAALKEMYPKNYGTFSDLFRKNKSLLGLIKLYVNKRRFKAIERFVPQGARVLDIGCGNGDFLLALRKMRPDLKLAGIDWYFPKQTRDLLQRSGIEVFEGAVEMLDLGYENYDFIFMLQLLEHLWDPAGSLRKIHKSMAPNGKLIIETPNIDGYDRRLFHSGTWGGYYAPRHLFLFNKFTLRKLAENTGFIVLSEESLPAPIVWSYSFQSWLRERYGDDSFVAKLFSAKNVIFLGIFYLFDSIARLLKKDTSNQQMVLIRAPSLFDQGYK
jgi:2-polyprenyl-3-methyl-5-hydroxy-6-metoxy-1,4-benzoquinol methylase